MEVSASDRVVRIGFLVSLVVGFSASSCKSRKFDSTSNSNSSDEMGRRARLVRARDSIFPLMHAITGKPYFNTFQEALFSKQETINNIDPSALSEEVTKYIASTRDVRTLSAAMARDSKLRDLYESSMVNEMRRRSRVLSTYYSQVLKPDSGDELANWDDIVIGAGPHGAALAQQLTLSSPNRRVLVIDSGSRAGGTFADVGAAFALNSTTREYEGEKSVPSARVEGGEQVPVLDQQTGRGDLNNIGYIIGLPDFTNVRWPAAGGLGFVSSVSLDLSSADLLLESKVTRISPKNGSSDIQVMVLLPSGKEAQLSAKNVVFATGIGRERFFLANQESLFEEFQKEAKELQSKTTTDIIAPRIQTFSQFVRNIGQSNRTGKNPMTPYIGKKILVVGGGDSGRVALEWFTGLGPEGSTGAFPSQGGGVSRIVWAGVDVTTCTEFVNSSRARYSRIAQGITARQIVLAPVNITGLLREGQGVKVVTSRPKKGLKSDNSINAAFPLPLTYEVLSSMPRVNSATGLTEEQLVKEFRQENGDVAFDYVIDATGFRNEDLTILRSGFGAAIPDAANLSDIFKKRSDEIPAFRKQNLQVSERAFASQLCLNKKALDDKCLNIWAVGPANEQIAALPSKDETERVSANTVSLFANIERTKFFGEKLGNSESFNRESTNNLIAKRAFRPTNTTAYNRFETFESLDDNVKQDKGTWVQRIQAISKPPDAATLVQDKTIWKTIKVGPSVFSYIRNTLPGTFRNSFGSDILRDEEVQLRQAFIKLLSSFVPPQASPETLVSGIKKPIADGFEILVSLASVTKGGPSDIKEIRIATNPAIDTKIFGGSDFWRAVEQDEELLSLLGALFEPGFGGPQAKKTRANSLPGDRLNTVYRFGLEKSYFDRNAKNITVNKQSGLEVLVQDKSSKLLGIDISSSIASKQQVFEFESKKSNEVTATPFDVEVFKLSKTFSCGKDRKKTDLTTYLSSDGKNAVLNFSNQETGDFSISSNYSQSKDGNLVIERFFVDGKDGVSKLVGGMRYAGVPVGFGDDVSRERVSRDGKAGLLYFSKNPENPYNRNEVALIFTDLNEFRLKQGWEGWTNDGFYFDRLDCTIK